MEVDDRGVRAFARRLQEKGRHPLGPAVEADVVDLDRVVRVREPRVLPRDRLVLVVRVDGIGRVLASAAARGEDEHGEAGKSMAHRRPVPVDALWALLFATAGLIAITYSRLPPEELYNVSEEGVTAGLGRALVFLNYPVSLIAISIAWLAAGRLATRRAFWAAGAATLLCGVTALPGVVDQHDLDAKAVNLLPAVGVAIALVLSIRAPWERVGRLPLDPVRVVIGAVVWLVALVWIAAVAGVFFPGDVLLGEEIRRGGDGLLAPAVHLGDHEGLDAALLVTAALILTRYRPPLRRRIPPRPDLRLRPRSRVARLLVRAARETRMDCVDAAERSDSARELRVARSRPARGPGRSRRQADRRASATRRRSSTRRAVSSSRFSDRRIDDGCTVAMTTGARSDSTGTPRSRLTRNCRPRSA